MVLTAAVLHIVHIIMRKLLPADSERLQIHTVVLGCIWECTYIGMLNVLDGGCTNTGVASHKLHTM
jgi:hypothetical protein